ncbi:MAG: hypothetical protein WCT08_02355 [Patescibacteria group bacterium]
MVTKDHLRQFLALIDRHNNPISFLFEVILGEPNADTVFGEKAILMMVRNRKPEQLKGALKIEFLFQVKVILWILGPVWLANDRRLPRVTGFEWAQAMSNEPRIDWDGYFRQFGRAEEIWQKIIDDCLTDLKNPCSRLIIGRITRMFLVKLPGFKA